MHPCRYRIGFIILRMLMRSLPVSFAVPPERLKGEVQARRRYSIGKCCSEFLNGHGSLLFYANAALSFAAYAIVVAIKVIDVLAYDPHWPLHVSGAVA